MQPLRRKIDRARIFLEKYYHLFQCPFCRSSFNIPRHNGLTCNNGHNFDLSRKGTLFFLSHPARSEYDSRLLNARMHIARAGFFGPLQEDLQVMLKSQNSNPTLLEAGCGEGSLLAALPGDAIKIGFDISRPAIELAATQPGDSFWCVADLGQPPFADQRFDFILNILTPANYSQFKRILKPNGNLIKVIPGPGYLRELRQFLFRQIPEKRTYSNDRIKEHFKQQFPGFEYRMLRYNFKLDQAQLENLIAMTPLTRTARASDRQALIQAGLDEVTVEFLLMVGQPT